jgi:DNA-binding response OmpR family regulator
MATPILLLTALDDSLVEMVGRKAGADDYLTKPFNMLELTTRIERLLCRVSTSKSRNSHVPQEISTPQSDAPRSVGTAEEDLVCDPASLQDKELWEEIDRRIDEYKDYSRLADLTRQLRGMLDQEKLSPHTDRNSAFLNAADGVIGFLEEIFHEVRSPGRRR